MRPTPPEMPRILVLLATFNGARWLPEQLASIAAQSGVSCHVLVSDDGSTDDTLAVLRAWRPDGASLDLLPTPGPGRGACANFLRLLREADLDGYDAIALADQDDIWLSDRLQRACEWLRHEAAAGYSSDATAFWSDGRRQPLGKADPQRTMDYLFEPAGPGCSYVLSAALARALQQEFRDRPARFDGIGYHDWLIYAYARCHGQRWVIDPRPGLLYRQHGANELGANFGAAGVHRRWGRLTSGWFREQVLQIGRLWPGPHQAVLAPLDRLGLVDRLRVALVARQLRRRPRDQLALAVMLLIGVLR